MLAAQQQYAFPHLQDSRDNNNRGEDGVAPVSGNAPGGYWQDEQESFLRNLLESSPLDPQSGSIASATSQYSQSPPFLHQATSISSGDEAGRNSSLSPVSSSGYQSLHEFIHANGGQPSMSASSNGGQATPTDSEVPLSQMNMPIKHEHPGVDALSFPSGFGPGPSPLDPGAIDFFVNMMTNDPNAVNGTMHPMMQHGIPTSQSQLNFAMLQGQQMHQAAAQHQHGFLQQHQQSHPQFAQGSHMPVQSFAPQNQHFTFQSPMMARTSLPFAAQQQQSMSNLPPALDSRKRSAPSASNSTFESLNHAHGEMGTKRARKPSTGSTLASHATMGGGAASMMPHMEVGSNATALAAIERLKAKKLAAAELESKARANKMDVNGKSSRQSLAGVSSGVPAHKQEKKVAHNAIERRYRNNINARIAALRNTVPALRELRPKKPSRKGKEAPPEDLVDGVPAATKLNKATILGKATEYIRYLKGRETRLVSEVAGLRELIRSLEGGEELLDLWQGEMERVVSEQEALVKAQLAAMDDDSFDVGDDDDDDDDEDDDNDVKPSSSPSTNGSASSRYMMGVFMGFSVLGGGAEIVGGEHASSASPTEHAHSVLRASSGRVIGASHQLLKRSLQATNVNLGRLADDPHHYDHVANHLLVVEVLRGLALLACLMFIFWPWIARLSYFNNGGKRRNRSQDRETTNEEEMDLIFERKEMLAVLNNPHSSPHQADSAMRRFVGAPHGAILSVFSLTALTSHLLAQRVGLISRPRGKRAHEEEKMAIWCRLLELETSLGPLAQRSLLARLHTILSVSTSPWLGVSSRPSAPLLNPSRVFGTIAIALSRASNGMPYIQSFAERYWVKARRCRLLAVNGLVSEQAEPSADRWLDPLLEMDLLTAVSLCPMPTNVANTFSPQVESVVRTTMSSPLISIAASQHTRQLSIFWTILLRQIVQMTYPAPINDAEQEDRTAALTCAEFVKHYSEAQMKLPLSSDAAACERMTNYVTELTLTSPHSPRVQVLCNVTLASWALLMGNTSVARTVALAIVRASEQGSVSIPLSAVELVSLVLGEKEAKAMTSRAGFKAAPSEEIDSLAAAALAWIGFLRLLSQQLNADAKQQDLSNVASSAISIRRLLAAARTVRLTALDENLADLTMATLTSTDRLYVHRDSLASVASSQASISSSEEATTITQSASRIAQNNLDDALDTLTDILTVLGRRAAMGGRFTKETLLRSDEQTDSGVEWSPSSN